MKWMIFLTAMNAAQPTATDTIWLGGGLFDTQAACQPIADALNRTAAHFSAWEHKPQAKKAMCGLGGDLL